MILRTIVLCSLVAGVLAGSPHRSSAEPKEQFQSVVYVRKAGAPDGVYKQLHPDTIAMAYPADFHKWGGKFMYMWFFPHLIKNKGGTTGFDAGEVNDPRDYIDTFSRAMWNDWEKLRGLGIVTGQRPARFEDLWCLTEKYALAQRDGTPRPNREEVAYKDRMAGGICIANPDAVRIMVALEKYNAAHLFDNKIRPDGYMPVNGGFVDLDGFQGCPMDYSEFSRASSTPGCTPTTARNKSGRSSRPTRRSRFPSSRRKAPAGNLRRFTIACAPSSITTSFGPNTVEP